MVNLNNNEIQDKNEEENVDVEPLKEDFDEETNVDEFDEETHAEEFSIENYESGISEIIFDEALKEGMSYSPKMLDINELFEKGVVKRGDEIDLRNFPEVETIQAACQEQLDMLVPASKDQITIIHLSNNTPVGWNDDYNYSNEYPMDKELDLTDYKNVTEVQTHFYVNDELENIKLPEGVKEILCRHSKMINLHKNEDLKDIKITLDRAETSFGIDDGDIDEYDEFCNLENYHNIQEKDSSYTLYYQNTPVLKDLKEPAEVENPRDYGESYDYENKDFNLASRIKINGDEYAIIEPEGETNPKFYLKCLGEDCGRNCQYVTFKNSLNPNEKINSLVIVKWHSGGMFGSYNRDIGIAEATGCRDVGRGYAPGSLTMYTKQNGEYFAVSSSEYCDSPRVDDYIEVYDEFLKMLEEKGINLSNEEREAKERAVFDEMKESVRCDKDELQKGVEHPWGIWESDSYHPRINEMIDKAKKEAYEEISAEWNKKTPLDKIESLLNGHTMRKSREYDNSGCYRLNEDGLLKSILDEGVDFDANSEQTTKVMKKIGKRYDSDDWDNMDTLKSIALLIEYGAHFGDEHGLDSEGKPMEYYEWGRTSTVQNALEAQVREAYISEKQTQVKHRNNELLKRVRAKIAGTNEEKETGVESKPEKEVSNGKIIKLQKGNDGR